MKTDLTAAQARSLLWAARHMQDLLNVSVKVPNPDPVQATGCFFSAILLRAFAAEVALKAMYTKETGKAPQWEHNLSIPFCGLKPSTQRSLDQRFQRIRKLKAGYDGRSQSIEQVINDHKDDFVHWRYIFERQGPSNVDLLTLEPAVEAVIEEYNS